MLHHESNPAVLHMKVPNFNTNVYMEADAIEAYSKLGLLDDGLHRLFEGQKWKK